MHEKTKEDLEYEERLRYRLNILIEQLKKGKVVLPEGLETTESLKAIRYDDKGEINLDTVDGFVRSLALGVEMISQRQEMKSLVSLQEIQTAYFTFLHNNFSVYYNMMKKNGLTPHDCATALTRNENTIKELKSVMLDCLEHITSFWEELGDTAIIHIEDMNNTSKGVFGGDLFPSHNENIASKCGIYTDTIILPDPFLRSKHIFEIYPDSKKVYYFIKHVMNLLQYKDLACTDLDKPILVVLPDTSALDKREMEFNSELGKDDSLYHYAKLFGRKFESFDDFMDFASSLDNIEKLISEVKEPSRLLFDSQWGNNPKVQLKKMIASSGTKSLGITHPGELIMGMSVGRMSISNELLIKARRLGGTPIIDAPTSWQYFKWKLEYDSNKMESITHINDLHITKALQSLSDNDMQWIGNISPESLIAIRKEGAMDEIRSILSAGIEELTDINPNNFHRTHDQIFDNITNSFNEHKKNIKELRDKKWKFAGQDIGSWLVVGGIEISAALTGAPLFGLTALGAGQLIDTPKIKDFPKRIKDLKEENDKLQKSPVGMFFNIKHKS